MEYLDCGHFMDRKGQQKKNPYAKTNAIKRIQFFSTTVSN